ncbi:DUF6332 family protein [Streptomyces kanamyceticus]|uniref:Uncharacterized protein n=1 Tax=Streptomyces kanamyceticus TaxID=1967 RepID=A0A5J6GJV9_STRKN|nr:DUF6332 family protein [Streptomyces kanamyceticus]QEU94704.1 hypothetical protein CP970_30855 [Streptomyces kanamyceticus]
MDMGRESRWEKDAMTVEIMFALLSAAFLAVAVVGLVLFPTLFWDVPSGVDRGLKVTAGVLALAAAVGQMVRVLWRHDRHRRDGR